MPTTRRTALSALSVLAFVAVVALGCDDGTLTINTGEPTAGDGGSTEPGPVDAGLSGTVGGTSGPVDGGPSGTGGGTSGAGGGTSGTGGGSSGTGGGAGAGGGAAAGGGTGTGGGEPTGTIDQAVVISTTLPAQLACSQRTNVTVTVRNTGDTTWTAAGNYRLGAVDDQDPLFTGGNRVNLGAGDSVAPGQEHTFTIELAAPSAGTYPTDWRMVRDGVAWFGDVAARSVVVACTATGPFYPCVIDGQFNMPAHEQRIASRNASLLRTGHVITGNDAIDNAVLGGGSPDGGIWLSGQFHFEIDANGQITSASWIAVFSPTHYSVTGGVYTNGEIHMGSPAGLDISGLISGGLITGFVAEAGMSITRGDSVWNSLSVTDRDNLRGIWHGNDIEYVHGLMSGTWSPR